MELVQQEKDNNSKFVDLLNSIMSEADVSQLAVCEKLRISRGYPSAIRSGDRTASQKLINSTAELLADVRSGKWPKKDDKSNVSAPISISQVGRKDVPVVSWARAGVGASYEDVCSQIAEWVVADTSDENAFGVIIEGDSMEPEFVAGTRVVISPNSTPRNGCFVLAKRTTGEVVFKRYYQKEQGRKVRLESVNPDYAPIEADREEYEWIYPVVSSVRKLWF